MSHIRAFTVIALLAAVSPFSARAAEPVDAAGAAKLKGMYEQFLTFEKNMSAAQGPSRPFRFQYDGDVKVVPSGAYYAVTLPHILYVNPDGSRLDIGMVSINASPSETPGQWKMAIAVPTPIVFLDPQKTQMMKINIGAQKAVVVWDENLKFVPKMDTQYTGITVDDAKDGFTLQIPDIEMRTDMAKDAQGTWSSSAPGYLLAKDITASFAAAQTSVKLAGLRFDVMVDGFDPAIKNKYMDKLTALSQAAAAQNAAGTPPATGTPPGPNELTSTMVEMMFSYMNGLKGTYTLTGLDVSRTDPATQKPQTLKLANATLGINMENLKADKGNFGMRLAFDGFGMAPQPPAFDGIPPTTANIDIALTNVPAKQLAAMVQSSVQGAAANPGMAGLNLMIKAPGLLSQAGTVATLKNNYFGNDLYRFQLDGAAHADLNAVANATGKFSGTFRGLDALLAKIATVAADPKNPAAGEAQSLSQSLQVLKMYGKAQGADNYTYDLEITPQGQITVNGLPMGGPGLAPGAPAPVGAVPPPATLPAPPQ